MCLSIPAKLVEVFDETGNGNILERTGKVSIGGIMKQVSLAYVPEAVVGDYLLIHVGFAISIIDEQEAQFVFKYLEGEKFRNEQT